MLRERSRPLGALLVLGALAGAGGGATLAAFVARPRTAPIRSSRARWRAAANNRIQAFNVDGFQVGANADVNANLVTYHFLAVRNTAP